MPTFDRVSDLDRRYLVNEGGYRSHQVIDAIEATVKRSDEHPSPLLLEFFAPDSVGD